MIVKQIEMIKCFSVDYLSLNIQFENLMEKLIDSVDTKYQTVNCIGDPDRNDPVLHNFHILLWSKQLPNGERFDLVSNGKAPFEFIHESEMGDFLLSSDSIGHTYSRGTHGKIPNFINEIPVEDIESFFGLCSTIGGYIVFPSRMIDRKHTINQSRGISPSIKDRFDLTLECIRRWYIGEGSPLSECIDRYADFFELFGDFKGYTEFFLLQDLVDEETGNIRFWLPFEEFGVSKPLPEDKSEYLEYRNNLSDFILARNARIDEISIYLQD